MKWQVVICVERRRQLTDAVFTGRTFDRANVREATGRSDRRATRSRGDQRLSRRWGRRRCWRRRRIVDDDVAAGAGRDDFVCAAASKSNNAGAKDESALDIFHSERSPKKTENR